MSLKLKIPRLLGEGCVLQQGEKTRIWGWYREGEAVTVNLLGRKKSVLAGSGGCFEVFFENLPAGGPYVLSFCGVSGETHIVESVWVGEVYVCAGQSNMELPMLRVRERFAEEFINGGDESVHIYYVPECCEFDKPLTDHREAGWKSCRREKLKDISAFSYFFGTYIKKCRNVPVGIINLSVGGTPVEAWTSREGLDSQTYEDGLLYRNSRFRSALLRQQEEQVKSWYDEIERQEEESKAAEWKLISIPGYLSDAGLSGFCGCIILRRRFEVPEQFAEEPCLLKFGTMADSDQIFINGRLTGATGYRYPPRRYPVAAGTLKPGTNTIEVRLICNDGSGRITPGKSYQFVWEDNVCQPRFAIGLEGQWEYQVRAVCGPAPKLEFLRRKPAVLYQGMVAPCLFHTVRGVIWYQGESNDSRADQYEHLLEAMICDWRKKWQQPNLPFVIVQLPGCAVDNAPGEAWPKIREAQRRMIRLPQVAVTANLELGEENDLHPLNKKAVAYRAALAVRRLVYNENVVWQGPVPAYWRKEKGGVVLEFITGDDGGLLTLDGEEPLEFELAGSDGRFYSAGAFIDSHRIKVFCRLVKEPQRLRYAWSRAPHKGLLCNGSGLSAGPFEISMEEETDGIV